MKTMAEVLAEHRLDRRVQLVTMVEYWCICGKTFTNHESHQAAALTAAGFGYIRVRPATTEPTALSAAGYGLVADAKREAWDEGAQAEADATGLTEEEEASGEHAMTFVCPSQNPLPGGEQ